MGAEGWPSARTVSVSLSKYFQPGNVFFKNESLLHGRVRTAQAVTPGIVYLIDLLISEAKICIELGLTGNPFAFTPLGSFLRAW